MPVAVLVAVYWLLGPLLFGTAWAFNFSYVGRYMMPDIALLILVATVPDLIQGLSKITIVVVERMKPRQPPGPEDGAVVRQ